MLLSIDGKSLYLAAHGATKIPSTVEIIKSYAFAEHDFVSIKLPASVEEIYGFAFSGCKNLVEVEMSDNVKISNNAFWVCDNYKG